LQLGGVDEVDLIPLFSAVTRYRSTRWGLSFGSAALTTMMS
jgi:hypothetical protein